MTEIKITIDGTDRTSLIDWKKLKIIKKLTSQVDVASFQYKKFGDRTWTPEENKEIVVEFDADDGNGLVKVFAGFTTDVTSDLDAGKDIRYTVRCKDYNFLLDRQLPVATFSNQDPKEIIDALIAEFAFGFGITTTNVDATPEIDRIDFKYDTLRRSIQKIAEITFKDWFIDEDKDIHMFNRFNEFAPFELTDSNGNLIKASLDWREDITNLKNDVFILGGEYEGLVQPDKFIGRGSTGNEKEIFVLGYKPKISGFTLVVTSTGGSPSTGTVGIEGLADETVVTAVINQPTKTLRFTSGNFPTEGEVIEATYTPILPVIVEVEDQSSIEEFGRASHKHRDATINSKQLAKDIGRGILKDWSQPIKKGRFETFSHGLDSGQTITIDSTDSNLSGDFLIYEVVMRPFVNNNLKYQVKFTSGRNQGFLEIMQNILTDPDRSIDSFTEEDIEKVKVISENIDIIESVNVQVGGDVETSDGVEATEDSATAIDTPHEHVWGSYEPSGIADPKRPLFWDVGSLWAT